MATPFHLTVITPEKIFFDGETTQIIVRTTEGDIGILANHTSLVASLPSGPLKVMTEDGSYRVAAVSAGLIKVGGNKVNIFADAVEWADEIDIEWQSVPVRTQSAVSPQRRASLTLTLRSLNSSVLSTESMFTI